MAKGFKMGGGGGNPLNFRVLGNPQPASPGENTIWIDTDIPITGYAFSAAQPADPMEGMVWIAVGTSSPVEFNALKKNGIQVYPLSAKQYVGGAWVDKEAKIYQGGSWVNWFDGMLYNAGNQYETHTGGWKAVAGEAFQVTFGPDKITIGTSGGMTDYEAAVYTENKVDVTRFTTLTAVFSSIAFPAVYDGQGVYVGLTSVNDNSCPTDKFVASKKHESTGTKTLSVDVSNITGSYYVAIVADVATCSVTKIYLS